MNNYVQALIHSTGIHSNILDMQDTCGHGEGGARAWLEETQRCIAAMDQTGITLNAVLEWNIEADSITCALDYERSAKGIRGPLHGIPILLKDNIGTGDGMHTSAGSLALADRFAVRDAFIAMRLREAGAVLCGKTNMTELANFMSDNMANGYSSRGGQVRSIWKADADPSGSSTGSAVAVSAGYVSLAIGTETCGSIISPAAEAGIAGLKPTVGRVSRSGIIPIAPSQDVAGPMARTVADCALAFSVIAGYDPEDPITGLSEKRPIPGPEDCVKYIGGLKGLRIGVYALDDGGKPVPYKEFYEAVRVLELLGAETVPFSPPPGAAGDMGTLLLHEFRPAMDLALRQGTGAIRSLEGIAAYNSAHAGKCLRYGQHHIDRALALPRPMLTPEYMRSRETARQALRALEQSFCELSLDAVISLHGLIAFPVTGSPALTFPVGFDEAEIRPVPVVLNGLPFSEGKLLGIGAALEAAIGKDFRPPLPTVNRFLKY